MPNLVPIFSTPIYFDDIHITEEEKQYCKSLSKNNVEQLNFYITADPHVIDHPQLSRIRAEALTHLNIFTKDILSIKQDSFEFVINTSWGIDLDHHSSVNAHVHTHSLYTAVIVLECTPDSRIYFSLEHNPLVPYFFDFEYIHYNTYNSRIWFFDLTPGQIYVFPSAVAHYAKCLNEGGSLSVLAFDAFIKGKIGDHVNKLIIK